MKKLCKIHAEKLQHGNSNISDNFNYSENCVQFMLKNQSIGITI
jgi:hypothetical protein